MKCHYDHTTDSLYIDLADRPAADSQEIAPGVVADFDANGVLVGIDIDHASRTINLSSLESNLPWHTPPSA